MRSGAEVYVASVAKFNEGIEKARERLSNIATAYSIPVVMVNCAGYCDGQECAGRSSAWNKLGRLQGQLDGLTEGILIYDTITESCIER